MCAWILKSVLTESGAVETLVALGCRRSEMYSWRSTGNVTCSSGVDGGGSICVTEKLSGWGFTVRGVSPLETVTKWSLFLQSIEKGGG